MNKNELVNAVTGKKPYRTRKGEVEKIVNATLNEMFAALARGEDVKLKGFGSFTVENRAERAGRNPSTGEAITIPARKAVKFSPGKELKDAVNA